MTWNDKLPPQYDTPLEYSPGTAHHCDRHTFTAKTLNIFQTATNESFNIVCYQLPSPLAMHHQTDDTTTWCNLIATYVIEIKFTLCFEVYVILLLRIIIIALAKYNFILQLLVFVVRKSALV